MMDGIVPDHNVVDDPRTWSPMSDIEEAADNVVTGRESGPFSFVRAGGSNLSLVVEDPPLFSSFEQGESSRLRSLVVGTLSLDSDQDAVSDHVDMGLPSQNHQVSREAILFLPNSGSFPALIKFLNDKIYQKILCLQHISADSVSHEDSVALLVSVLENVTAKIWKGLLTNVLSPHSILDYARALEIKRVLAPHSDRPSPFANLFLNESGELEWIPFHLMGCSLGLGQNSSGLNDQDILSSTANSIFESDADVSSAAPRRRGRPRKIKGVSETPVVKSMVRYCTRNNNEGYKPIALADTRKPRSTASKASAPSVLQIKEMQRIGVEECQIDPEELTEEQLMKESTE
jgi:hypothetical protein